LLISLYTMVLLSAMDLYLSAWAKSNKQIERFSYGVDMLISLVQQMPVIERILIYSYVYLQLFLRSCCVIILSVSMYPILILTD